MAGTANLETLKHKYQTAIDHGKARGVRWEHAHLQGEKLFLGGAAPNDTIKNEVWTKVKAIDGDFSDLALDLKIDSTLPAPAPAAAPAAKQQTYTVAKGDTLSAIAKRFYGDPKKYMTIFNANKNLLKDPDKISPGQELVIPEGGGLS